MRKELINELRRRGLSNGTSLGRHDGIMDAAADEIERLQQEIEILKYDIRATDEFLISFSRKNERLNSQNDKLKELLWLAVEDQNVGNLYEEVRGMRAKALESCTTTDTMRDFVVSACDEAMQKQVAKMVKPDGSDEQDDIRCPACDAVVGTNDDYGDYCSKFCENCGQRLAWKQGAETVNEFDGEATDGYHEQKKAMSSLSIAAVVRAIDYIACLSQFVGKENEVLDDMETVLEPLNDVVTKLMTDELCPKCSGHLFRSDLPQYSYVCPSCDENY